MYICTLVPDERAMEEEAEKNTGWLFKLIFAGTATSFGYHIFPYLGDNLIQQSVSLLNVKDPLFKRMGASRLARFATDDDRTCKEASNAIVAIARADEAVGALQSTRAILVIMATPESTGDAEIERYKGKLLRRLGYLKYDENSSSN
ncbi:hypothetical protein OSB04_017354 [Centaurea solstitialis]|uniref:Uncharacterized protein n=1 Tax=Centaurea solstitialis TaxID=347529 RepID=A0AA38WKM6_9ASTR|nr:hypothetical protein OSB04_017354 [Centaurea solstitialis]